MLNTDLATKTKSKGIANINAATENTRPIDWANLLGGPGTARFGLPIIGRIILVDSIPIGLSVGPVATLAKNPYARKNNSHGSMVTIVEMVKTKTIPATRRAAISLTGLGNENIPFKVLIYQILVLFE